MRKTSNGKNFSKKILSLLIEKAKGERTLKQFADDCGISYLQMRKLSGGLQENPPGKKLIAKLASASDCGITEEDYNFICRRESDLSEADKLGAEERALLARYRSLGSRQKKTAEDFIAFLESYNG